MDKRNIGSLELARTRDGQRRRMTVSRYQKISYALGSVNWNDAIELLSTFTDYAKRMDGPFVGYIAVIYNRCDVIEFLVQKRWPINLDELLSIAAAHGERSLETVERLCWLGAGGITNYGEACNSLAGQVATYRILLEHNVVSPRMFFCEEVRDSGENEIQQQQSLTFLLDIPEDRYKKRWGCMFRMVDDDEHGNALGLVELHAKNGASIAVQLPLLKKLPRAGPRVSAIMAAALRPASLQSLCRKAVRRVGPKTSFKSWVPKLGLPKRLSSYLCSSEA